MQNICLPIIEDAEHLPIRHRRCRTFAYPSLKMQNICRHIIADAEHLPTHHWYAEHSYTAPKMQNICLHIIEDAEQLPTHHWRCRTFLHSTKNAEHLLTSHRRCRTFADTSLEMQNIWSHIIEDAEHLLTYHWRCRTFAEQSEHLLIYCSMYIIKDAEHWRIPRQRCFLYTQLKMSNICSREMPNICLPSFKTRNICYTTVKMLIIIFTHRWRGITSDYTSFKDSEIVVQLVIYNCSFLIWHVYICKLFSKGREQ